MRAVWFASGLLVVSCSGGGDPPASFPDATTSNADGGVEPEGPEFEFEVAAGLGSAAIYGDNAVLALTGDGRPAIAHGVVPAGSSTREIHVAERAADGTWTNALALVPGANAPSGGDLMGLGFAYVGATPHLAYVGGDGDMNPLTPFPTDLMLATRTGATWTERTLVDTSGEAMADCAQIQNYCNFGGVVGTHAAIAPKPGGGGFAVVYRDTHNGFAFDDLARSDTEVYAEGGPFTNSNVDAVRGTGEFGAVAWLPNGNLVTAYNLSAADPGEDRVGVWAAVYDGAAWTRTRVSESITTARISLAIAADGTVWLAFYHADSSDLVVASSSDGVAWDDEAVESTGRTGLYPSIGIDAEGRPVVAYTYCGPQSDTECPGMLSSRSVVKLARKEAGAWKIYLADDGQENGDVGLFNSLVVLPDGKLAIAFQHSRDKDLIYLREK